MAWWHRFKQWALRLQRDVKVLGLALADPRTPWYARALALFIVAYALSPIDLIPDAIPVLGLLDELLLLPLLIAAAMRLIPAPVMADCRARAEAPLPLPGWLRWAGLAIIVAIWGAMAVAVADWLWEF
jgi:uncharacterized membrane protein YkvA (DUF1232 family)